MFTSYWTIEANVLLGVPASAELTVTVTVSVMRTTILSTRVIDPNNKIEKLPLSQCFVLCYFYYLFVRTSISEFMISVTIKGPVMTGMGLMP